jgi:DHA1 family bicyclomycin/chloramphenicol resistance-like MFS transporter
MTATASSRAGAAPAPSLLLLCLASSLSPFGMSVIFPALSDIAETFTVGIGGAQFLIAIYLFGLGIGQPIAGMLSDRLGRRPVMLAGFLVFTASSLACLLTADFALLVFMRFLQAIGVSVGTVVSRAIVRDTHDALGAGQALSWIGAGMGVAPMIGPVVGGLLSAHVAPVAAFGASAALGLVVTAALAAWLPETRRLTQANDLPQESWLPACMAMLGCRRFMGYTLLYAFTQGGFFAFLAVGAAVFENHLRVGPQTFGVVWGCMSVIYIGAAAAGAGLTARVGPQQVLRASAPASAVAGWALVLGVLTWGVTIPVLLLPIAMLMATAGVQTPLAMAGVVNLRPHQAGTAAGLSSSLALGASGVFSIAAGFVYSGSFLPIALLMAVAASLTVVTNRMSRY